MVSLRTSAYIIAAILAIYVAIIVSGWYENHTWFDIPLHFSGGFAMGFLALALRKRLVSQVHFQNDVQLWKRTLVELSGILGFVAIVSVVWEWHEFILSSLATHEELEEDLFQMTLGDTMFDFVMDFLGGITAFVAFRSRK